MNRIAQSMVAASASLAALSLASCNIVAPAAYLVEGPPTIDAEFKLPDRPTVVFVDDRRNVLNGRSIRTYMGDRTGELLLRHKILSAELQHAIRTGPALNAARSEETGKLLSLEEIGEAVGAEQLVYIDLYSFQLEAPDGSPRAQATLGVKVMDVTAKTRVFPDPAGDGDVRTLTVMLPPENTFQPMLGREARRQSELKLADVIADKVSKLFYKHEPRTPLGHQSAPETNPKAR